MLGPAGTGTFGGCDHTAGGRTAFLAHAYAWSSPGELGSWPVSRKGTIWKVCGFSFFFFLFFEITKTKEVKKGKRRKEKKTLEIGSDKVND